MNARWLLVLAFGPLAAAAGDPPEKAKAADLAAFQGDWRVVWVERDGERVEADEDAVYTVKGSQWSRGGRAISAIEIDPGYSPKLLDLTRLIDDANKGVKMEGIYTLDGDTMEWCCYTGAGAKERPQEFRAPKGWDGTVYHLERVKRPKD
jgi:uncharacterized protein (TIGR03067 family)